MELYPLDSSYFDYSDLQLFAIFTLEIDFSISAENSVSEPPNLENFLGEETPTPLYKARAFGTSDNAAPTPFPSNTT